MIENKNDRERVVAEIINGFFDGVHSQQVENRFFDWLADDRDRDLKDRSMESVWDRIDVRITREERKALARFKSLRRTESRRKWIKTAVRNAAAVLLPPLAVAGIWLFAASGIGNTDEKTAGYTTEPRETVIRIVSPERGGGETILPDNSRVTLAEGSWLLYTKETFDEERRVEMVGECGFSVVGDKGPFVVKTNNVAVKVLGTEFSICDRPGSDVTVSLSRGSVEVEFGQDNRSAILVPGETLRFDPATGISRIEAAKTEKIKTISAPVTVKKENPPEEIIQNPNPGEFNCDEMPIAAILSALEEHYGYIITIDQQTSLKGCYSVNFSGDEKLETIMNVISIMSGLEYVVSDTGRQAFVTSKE